MEVKIFNILIMYDIDYNTTISIIDTNRKDIVREYTFLNDVTIIDWMRLVNKYCIIFNHPLIYPA